MSLSLLSQDALIKPLLMASGFHFTVNGHLVGTHVVLCVVFVVVVVVERLFVAVWRLLGSGLVPRPRDGKSR